MNDGVFYFLVLLVFTLLATHRIFTQEGRTAFLDDRPVDPSKVMLRACKCRQHVLPLDRKYRLIVGRWIHGPAICYPRLERL